MYTFIFTFFPRRKPSDLIILTLTGMGVNVLDLWWERSERRKKKTEMLKERNRERRERTTAIQSTTSFPSMRKRSHHQADTSALTVQKQILTCAGVGIVAGVETGVLGVAGVEAAAG